MKTEKQFPFEPFPQEVQKLILLLNEFHSKDLEFFTSDELAAYIRRPLSYVYYLTSKRQIPYTKKGKRIYIYKTDVDQWLKGGIINPLV